MKIYERIKISGNNHCDQHSVDHTSHSHKIDRKRYKREIIEVIANAIVFLCIFYFIPIPVYSQSCCDIGNIEKISSSQYEIKTYILPDCPEEDVFKMLNKTTKKLLKKSGYESYLIVERNLRSCRIQLFKDTTEKSQAIKVLRGKKDKLNQLSQRYIVGTTTYKQFSDDIKMFGGKEHQIESKQSSNPYHYEIFEVVEFGGLFKLYARIEDDVLKEFKLADTILEFPEY